MSACAVRPTRRFLWHMRLARHLSERLRGLWAGQREALEFMVLASLNEADIARLGLDRATVEAELAARAD